MSKRENYKIFNDSIHGTIVLHPLLVKIIDTPEFQRLRNVKQLGAGYFVFPGAQHNRFEHCIGTAHLAGKVVRHLKDNQDREEQQQANDDGSNKITDKDVLCVEIAGLCHDLGHGPFSHLFDSNFLKRDEIKKRLEENDEVEWTHERQSRMIFRRIMSRLEQDDDYEQFGKDRLGEKDKEFVEELIDGPIHDDGKYKGRPEKQFLYDIISNKESGVDVDKWDYFARDCHHLGVANGFDHNRYIQMMRVAKDKNGNMKLCVRDKESFNLYQMFHTRFTLHKRAYQHKVVKAIEHMITDALCEANDTVKIPKDNGESVTISQCAKRDNLEAYVRLDDRVLQMIEHSPDGSPGKEILMRILRRDLYSCVAEKPLQQSESDQSLTEKYIRESIAKMDSDLDPNDIAVSIVNFNYGKKTQNPVDTCWFYKKDKPNEATKLTKEEVSRMLPEVFQESWVQVFSKKSAKKGKVKTAFENWYEQRANQLKNRNKDS